MASSAPVTRLPFLTKPHVETRVIGTEATGTLEFPVYHDLTVSEAHWLAANGGGKSAFQFTSKCALYIARNEKCKPIDAHGFVAKILSMAMGNETLDLSEDETTWSVKYVRELEECALGVLESTAMTQTALVTCIIRHRLDGMEDWLPSDTAKLPSDLCNAILEFAMEERDRGAKGPTPEEAIAETEAALGKLRSKVQPIANQSTGPTSTTSSESSTQEAPTSSRKRSASRKRATSSTASRKGSDSGESNITP